VTTPRPIDDEELARWRQSHVYDSVAARPSAERRTRWVVWITAVTMVVEIAAGWWFNSMALLADGWHMSSHTVALGVSALAYATARRHAADPRYAFGTFKVEVLGGFASAVFLLGVAGMMAFASVERLFQPQEIQYREALVVAVLGLLVNVVCALILGGVHEHGHAHGGHGHGHDHDHGHDHGHGHGHGQTPGSEGDPAHRHDLNLRAAYIHVLTDAATSVLAVVALALGWLYGWDGLDPVMGLVGAVIVAVWARGLLAATARILLDREMDDPVVEAVREAAEAAGDRVVDLHVWRVGQRSHACALTVVTRDPGRTPDDVRWRLRTHEEIVHATIEVHCLPPTGR
jgi:cation diffusion facilitator family transporter